MALASKGFSLTILDTYQVLKDNIFLKQIRYIFFPSSSQSGPTLQEKENAIHVAKMLLKIKQFPF